jgi:hypothetical protein
MIIRLILGHRRGSLSLLWKSLKVHIDEVGVQKPADLQNFELKVSHILIPIGLLFERFYDVVLTFRK